MPAGPGEGRLVNLRILRIELTRSAAPWTGAAVLASALAFLYLLPGGWWHGTVLWTAQWTSMAMWTRYLLIDFDDAMIGNTRGGRLTRALVGQGIAPLCHPRNDAESGLPDEEAARSIGAAWVFGDLQPLDGSGYSAKVQATVARPVWQKFIALPPAEQRLRIGAMHAAALSCSGDPLAALS